MQMDLFADYAPAQPQRPATLAEAIAYFDAAVSDHPRRAQIKSAFKGVSRVLRLPLHEIPTDPVELRALLSKASCVTAGVRPTHWKSQKSLVVSGLRQLGVDVLSGRDATPLAAGWRELLQSVADRKLQIALSRFSRYCSRKNLGPDDVSEGVFDAFCEELESKGLNGNPKSIRRQTAKHWNTAVREVPGWPSQLLLPLDTTSRRYALEWDEFPACFVDDVRAFIQTKQFGDEFDDNFSPNVRPATSRHREQMLRRVASALVLSGTLKAEQITSLSVLCDIEHVRSALRFFRERHPERAVTGSTLNYAWLLITVARYWVQDAQNGQSIAKLIRSVGGESRRTGITAKNRERLRQFDVPENLEALVELPMKTLSGVRRRPEGSYRESVRVMYALMIGVLTYVPIRAKNLTELQLGLNLIDLGKGARREVRIHLPGSMTKTYRDIDAPLPPGLYPLLDAWLHLHRGRVSSAPSRYLFPSPRGELRSQGSLSAKLPRFAKRETGLTINLHLFRHLAAKVYLEHDPNGIEVVRQLLGHSTIRTTERVYAELRTDPAYRRLDEALQRLTLGRSPTKGARRMPGELL